jgi:hypothetical protein
MMNHEPSKTNEGQPAFSNMASSLMLLLLMMMMKFITPGDLRSKGPDYSLMLASRQGRMSPD